MLVSRERGGLINDVPVAFDLRAALHKQGYRSRLYDICRVSRGNFIGDNHIAPVNHADSAAQNRTSRDLRSGNPVRGIAQSGVSGRAYKQILITLKIFAQFHKRVVDFVRRYRHDRMHKGGIVKSRQHIVVNLACN